MVIFPCIHPGLTSPIPSSESSDSRGERGTRSVWLEMDTLRCLGEPRGPGGSAAVEVAW